MMDVPKRTLVAMMNALSSGVVPRRGLEYIAVGRRKETETFISDMETTKEGGGAFRIISGRYGNGKSFLMQMVRNKAMDEGFVVMDADLSVNRRLTGGKNEGLATYRELVKNMAVKSKPDGGALESVIQDYIERSLESEDGTDDLERSCSHLKKVPQALSHLPFAKDVSIAFSEYLRDTMNEGDGSDALRWFKGEYDTKRDSKHDLGIGNIPDDSNWYDMIKIWAEISVLAGYRGLIVFIDEAVVLYKLQSKISRSNNYERMLTILNDIMQGKATHLSVYVCGTPEFIEDPNRGLYSYEALRSRLSAGRYENNVDNYMGPVMTLRPLSNEDVFVLIKTIRDLYELRYGWQSGIDDQMLEDYLREAISSSVSASLVTPREITRDLISLMDTMKQNPDAPFYDLIEGRSVEADHDPDNDLFGDLEA